jgi:hypothetical protein
MYVMYVCVCMCVFPCYNFPPWMRNTILELPNPRRSRRAHLWVADWWWGWWRWADPARARRQWQGWGRTGVVLALERWEFWDGWVGRELERWLWAGDALGWVVVACMYVCVCMYV